MSKRIAFCADGTWDSAKTHTNVFKLYNALIVSADQMPFYDSGVGATTEPIEKLAGGAFGAGIFQKIKDGYTKIAQVYNQDDDIFIFGFSRGAYTARSLAGMIAVCGLPTANFDDTLVNNAFDAYRERDQASRQQKLKALAKYDLYDAKIKMVGVWDTVGSLGIPSVISGVDPALYGFLDTSLHPDVLNAYHALALDEMRCEFHPTLWTGSPAPGQTLEQVWFCGVHSDVGGGEADTAGGCPALSDITLGWMMDKASALGLKFHPEALAAYELPLDSKFATAKLHTSWSILCGPPVPRIPTTDASIANSVAIRLRFDNTWRPEKLAFQNGALASSYRIVNVLRAPDGVAATQRSANQV